MRGCERKEIARNPPIVCDGLHARCDVPTAMLDSRAAQAVSAGIPCEEEERQTGRAER